MSTTGFWHRLQQRKLVQWAVAYVAAAFALLRGVDIVSQHSDWPQSVSRFLIIASVVGFFVTLLLAWYHGEHGAQTVRISNLEKEVELDPRSAYAHAVHWSSNPDDWKKPETAIVSYDWNALLPAGDELQSWEAYRDDTVINCGKTRQALETILSVLQSGKSAP